MNVNDIDAIDSARGEYDAALRWMQTPANGATVASHGARNDREQRLGISARTLMKAGVMAPVKRKYNPYR